MLGSAGMDVPSWMIGVGDLGLLHTVSIVLHERYTSFIAQYSHYGIEMKLCMARRGLRIFKWCVDVYMEWSVR